MDLFSFSNNEELCNFMLNELKLSRVDNKFLENLVQRVLQQNTITSNQNLLFKKIIVKYRKQFTKKKLNSFELQSLEWSCQVIESSPVYTEAYISIENNKINFRAPYKKEFISAYRKFPMYSFQWSRDKKLYESEFGLSNLKQIYDLAKHFYNQVNLCPIVTSLLNQLKIYESAKIWGPSLVLSNNKLLIAAANENLINAIADIDLNLELKNISKLVCYGINVEQTVKDRLLTCGHSEEKIEFVINTSPTVDLENIEKILDWLIELEVDLIIETNSEWRYINNDQTNLRQRIVDKGLNIHNVTMDSHKSEEKKSYKNPVIFKFRSYLDNYYYPINALKIIRFVNSQPIELIR